MTEWAITSSVLILVVLVLRRCLKGKISLRLQYGLWALVLVRLLIPISFGHTGLSVLNGVAEIQTETFSVVTPVEQTTSDFTPPHQQLQTQLPTGTQSQPDFTPEIPDRSISTSQVWMAVWDVGAVAVGLWLLGVNLRFAQRLRRSRRPLPMENCPVPVYVTQAVPTPCLFGLFRPSIYITPIVAADEAILRHSLAHELTHYRHRDHLWSALRGLCLALHWNNPLVWLAAVVSSRDGELCCDEATVARLGEGERAAYGRTLLAVTCQGHANLLLTATSMTGRGREIKERIVLLAKHPKTAVYTLAAVVLISAVAVGCTFTGAQPEVPDEAQRQTITTADLDWDGEKEEIQVAQRDDGAYQFLVCKEDGTQLLQEDAGTSHMDRKSIYLYTDQDGREYLLRYTPYVSTSTANYQYTLFSLDGNNTMVADQGSISFNINEAPERRAELEAFAQQVNRLLSQSALLVSTQDGEFLVGPEETGAHLEQLEILDQSLTQEELEQYLETFNSIQTLADGSTAASYISCFFTSYYEQPQDLNLEHFLRYFPDDSTVSVDENNPELQALMSHPLWPLGSDLSFFNVPIHRYTRETVDQVLEQYAGITSRDLSGVGEENLIYLEEYDAWYNFTSDFGPGTFPAVHGSRMGNRVFLYTKYDMQGSQLILEETGNGFRILSHLRMEE